MVSRLRTSAAILGAVCCVGTEIPTASDRPLLASVESAYVLEEEDGRGWVIGNGLVRYRLGLDTAGLLVARTLDRPGADVAWRLGQSPDVVFSLESRPASPGQPGFPFRAAAADEERGGVRLRLTFDEVASGLRVTRTYLCHPRVPVIETWTRIEALASDVALSDLGVWQLSVDVRSFNWLTGLQAPAASGGRFTRRHHALAARSVLRIGSTTRSSVDAVPAAWFDGDAGQFFGALLWSGAWHLSVAGPEPSGLTAIRMVVDQASTTVRRGVPVETPHGIFGITGAGPADVPEAFRAFVVDAQRQGRPMPALVAHNTWFAYGIIIDDATLRGEMEQAADLGAEVFVVDAGWYPGGTEPSDFSRGLGTWMTDTRRFPEGLRPLRDHAHDLGLKFGIWVEPERVDTATVGRAGLARERYLATIGGRYNAGVKNANATAAQVCLADREAREWVIAKLFAFLDEVQPDYLKWDNNYWINCDRSNHGHGASDGNFAHTMGLYDVLSRVRERHPDLIVENCSQGGNRLDLGLTQYADVAWMDDVSGPSAHVRHNVTGLGAVFPPAHLLSFVMDDPAEPIHQAADMPLYFRSRMAGVLGLSLRGAEFRDEDREAMRHEIAVYKAMRAAVPDAVLLPLTGQSSAAGLADWEALQWSSRASGNAVALAFAGIGAPPSFTLRPQGLDLDAQYTLSVPRVPLVARLSGRALAEDGFSLRRWPFSDAYVVFVNKSRPD